MEPWVGALERIGAESRAKVVALRTARDRELEELGGDPTSVDWSDFRPLRRDREEDWSDWLAQLIRDSEGFAFAWRLFHAREQRPRGSYRARRILREHAVEDRRADLIVEWADGSYTHVEVKVGDPHLDKTPDTALKVERAMKHCSRGTDFLLVLPDQETDWMNLRDQLDGWSRVHVLTWRFVSRALRGALRDTPRESVRWRVWAHALCGAIDTELLELPSGATPTDWARRLNVPALEVALDVLGGDDG